jgi:hypothetical protein
MALAMPDVPVCAAEALMQEKRAWGHLGTDRIDIGFVESLLRDLIAEHGLSLELRIVRHEAHHWQVVVHNSNHRDVTIEVHDLRTVAQLRTRLTQALLSVGHHLAPLVNERRSIQ